jgi:hypothetical protein
LIGPNIGPVSDEARTWGRIGGLTAWSRNGSETMVGPAHRGFRARFERLVDPDGTLDPAERAIRADRARRAHMLSLAARSAEVRRTKKAGSAIEKPDPAREASHAPNDEHPSTD